MTLRNVLNRLDEDEARAFSSIQQGNINKAKTEAAIRNQVYQEISTLSSKFSEQLIRGQKEKNKRDEKEGAIAYIEEEREKRDAEASGERVPTDEEIEERAAYENDKATIKENKSLTDKAAFNLLNSGGTYQEADAIQEMSGWKLYGYMKEKAKAAGTEYKSWIAGEMANNTELEIPWQEEDGTATTFTPSQADTVEKKEAALRALRGEYYEQRGLLGVNKELLYDAGLYGAVSKGNAELLQTWRSNEAVEKSLINQQLYTNTFNTDQDFGEFVNSISTTLDPKNKKSRGYAGALDYAFDHLENMMKTGQIDEEQLEAIKNQTVVVGGKERKVGDWWQTRFKLLEQTLAEESHARVERELKGQEVEGKQVEIDFNNWTEEMRKNGQQITEDHIALWDQKYYETTGKRNPDFLSDYQTVEDVNGGDALEYFKHIRAKRGYLLPSDLAQAPSSIRDQIQEWVNEDEKKAERADEFNEDAKQRIGWWADEAVGFSEGRVVKNAEWGRGVRNATEFYEEKRQWYIGNLKTPDEAHELALKETEQRFKLDTNIPTATSEFFQDKPLPSTKERDRLVKNVLEDTQDMNPTEYLDYLESNVIKGTEKYLKEGEAFAKGTTVKIPAFYRVLARKRGLTGFDILNAQLKAAGHKGITNEPKIDKALKEESLKDLRRKLQYKTTKNQVNQAKYDAQDGVNYENLAKQPSYWNTNPDLVVFPLFTE